MKYNKDSTYLFLWVVLSHLSIIPMIMFATPFHYAVAFAVCSLTGISVSIFYHRLLSHRSFKTSKWIEYVGTIIASYGIVGSSVGWCSTHIQHHKYTDKPNDPHSPHIMPWWKVQWFSMFVEQLVVVPYLVRSKFHMWIHYNYFILITVILLVLIIIDPFLAIYAFLFPAMMLWNVGSFINVFAHNFGYRTYETANHSTNNFILGYILFGEGWHNNHHNTPKSPSFGEKWWEFDLAFQVIKLIRHRDE